MNKRIFKILILVCAFVHVTKAQTVFNKYFPSGSMSMGSAIERNADGNYLLSSYFVDSLSGVQGLDLKIINEQGSLLSSKRYLMPGNMPFLAAYNNCYLHEVSSRSILITAASYFSNNSTAIFVSVDRTTLDTNWVKYYSIPNYEFAFRSVTKINSNNFIFFGNKFSNILNIPQRPYYITMDTLGNILSTKEFSNFISYSNRQVLYDEPSNYLFFGGEDYTNPNFPAHFFMCTDTAGNEIWKKTNYGVFYISESKIVGNAVYYCGMLKDGLIGQDDAYKLSVMKLNKSNGQLIWQKTYGERHIVNSFYGFHFNNDGSIVATGSYKSRAIPLTSTSDGVLLKLNENGDSLWMHTYGNFGNHVNEVLYDIEKCSDGGYMLIGAPHFAQPPNSQIWVVKTDSMGFAPGLTTSFDEVKHTALTEAVLYPNPAGTSAYLNLPADVSANDVKLHLFNAEGKEVNAVITANHARPQQLNINCRHLPAGIYLLKLVYPNGKTELKRLALTGEE